MIQTGALTARSPKLNSTISPLVSFCRSANVGLTKAALSQVSLLIGLGHSCSQPLFAKRPSQTVGSAQKFSSSSAAGDTRVLAAAEVTASIFTCACFGANAVPAINPS